MLLTMHAWDLGCYLDWMSDHGYIIHIPESQYPHPYTKEINDMYLSKRTDMIIKSKTLITISKQVNRKTLDQPALILIQAIEPCP
jgi:phage antirepressor YoqD-like protein